MVYDISYSSRLQAMYIWFFCSITHIHDKVLVYIFSIPQGLRQNTWVFCGKQILFIVGIVVKSVIYERQQFMYSTEEKFCKLWRWQTE